MKRIALALAISLLFTAEKCGTNSEVNPENVTTGCFANLPLETISWAKDQLTFFQQPKSGPLKVVVYSYKNEQFLAFVNGFDNGPWSHIFDCSGTTLGKRGINYNEFYNSNKKLGILLEGSY